MEQKTAENELEERVQLSLLYDFYGALLKESQRRMFEANVLEDYNYAEIAEEEGISRQGVYDAVKRASRQLKEYEEKLGLVARFQRQQSLSVNRKKPVIGIIPLMDEEKESYWMLPGYMDGLIQAGGVPVMLPMTSDTKILQQLADSCDGFLFTGGQDVSPALYGEQTLPGCGKCCALRDEMEKQLFFMAVQKNKSVLGICRGIQFINAVLGGSLYQDLPSQRPSGTEHHQSPPYDVPCHRVQIVRESPLFSLLQKQEISVNSYHHQAVKNLSDKLIPMAYSEDGLVEAVCMPEKNFVWAVQWHPEFSFLSDENSRSILKKFVRSMQ